MARYAFKIAYDGTDFSGFQWQNHQPSVQGVIEGALRALEPDFQRLVAAGRTDSGVHALGQVVHADLNKNWDPYRLSEALNFHMKPEKVACLACALVEDEFSARFSAIQRHYRYRIVARKAPLTVMRGRAWHVRHDLDVEAMHEAGQFLVGLHDFTTFRSSICQAQSPIKTVDEIGVTHAEGLEGAEVHITAKARSFLHNQVRSFVGTLERVGRGSWKPSDVKSALEAKSRAACGPVCPPEGLYLERVIYPQDIFVEAER